MKKEIVNGADVQESATANDDLFKAHLITDSAFLTSVLVNSYLAKSVPQEAVIEAVGKRIKSVNEGDLSQVEGMLLGQAIALQGIFVDLADRAQRADSVEKVQCFTQLALRAQSGSRNTLQTLIESKNPRQVAFFKQTNVAQTQQVNNGPASPSREKKIKEEPIELLVEESHGGAKMDTGAKTASSGAHQDLVSLETIDRPQNRKGKAKRLS